MARVIAFGEIAPSPWRNGGGSTREIASAPSAQVPGEPAWRLSVADVTQPGDFSAFPGVDRVLVLCRGSLMVLTVDGREHPLAPFEMIAFRGEVDTRADLPEGSTVDLNVMTRRGEATAEVEVLVVDGSLVVGPPVSSVSSGSAGPLLVVVVEGDLRRRTPVGTAPLADFDTVVVDPGGGPVELLGHGRVVVVRLGRDSETPPRSG